jgi:hypothetical protein
MRYPLVICLLIAAAVLAAGCTLPGLQPPAATPAPEPAPAITTPVTLPPAVTTTVAPRKEIDINAKKDGSDLIVRYNGGKDAGQLVALDIRIDNYDGKVTKERETNPTPGQKFVFPYLGTANPDVVNVIGIFSDGTEQTVLLTTL